MIPKERIFIKGDVMTMLNIHRNQIQPKKFNARSLRFAVTKLNLNFKKSKLADRKDKKDVFFPYYL